MCISDDHAYEKDLRRRIERQHDNRRRKGVLRPVRKGKLVAHVANCVVTVVVPIDLNF